MTPALLTNTSRRPYSLLIHLNVSNSCASSVTSHFRATIWPPLPFDTSGFSAWLKSVCKGDRSLEVSEWIEVSVWIAKGETTKSVKPKMLVVVATQRIEDRKIAVQIGWNTVYRSEIRHTLQLLRHVDPIRSQSCQHWPVLLLCSHRCQHLSLSPAPLCHAIYPCLGVRVFGFNSMQNAHTQMHRLRNLQHVN